MSNLGVQYVKDTPNYFNVKGYLVHETCMDFVDRINKHLTSFVDPIILNLNDLEELDGSGVGVLVTLCICLKRQRKDMNIIAPKDKQPYKVLKQLNISGLLGVK